MRFRASRVFLLAFVATASVVQAQDSKKCNATAHECEVAIRQMMAGRRYLGLEVVNVKPGVVVKTVVEDSPAQRAGFVANDRIIAVNGRNIAQGAVRDFKESLGDSGNTGVRWVIVQRRGAYKKLDVRLEPYSKAQIDKIVAAHLAQSHTAAAGTGQ